jgi:hypothetical protein
MEHGYQIFMLVVWVCLIYVGYRFAFFNIKKFEEKEVSN